MYFPLIIIVCKYCAKFPEQQNYTLRVLLVPEFFFKKTFCLSLVFFFPHKFWLVLGFSFSDTLLMDMTGLGQQFVLPIAHHICGIIFTSLRKNVEYILFFFPRFCTLQTRSQCLWTLLLIHLLDASTWISYSFCAVVVICHDNWFHGAIRPISPHSFQFWVKSLN